jgi:hypothetical protein
LRDKTGREHAKREKPTDESELHGSPLLDAERSCLPEGSTRRPLSPSPAGAIPAGSLTPRSHAGRGAAARDRGGPAMGAALPPQVGTADAGRLAARLAQCPAM